MLTVGIHVYPCCKFDFRTQIKIICTPLLNTMLFTTRYSGISREIKKRFQSFLYGFVDCIPWCRYFQYERRPPRCTRDKCFEFLFFSAFVWYVVCMACVQSWMRVLRYTWALLRGSTHVICVVALRSAANDGGTRRAQYANPQRPTNANVL